MESIFESLENLQVSEACFDEVLTLIEEYINELNDGTYRRARDIAKAVADEQEKYKKNVKSAEDLKNVEDDIIKKRHQAAIFGEKRESRVIEREKQKYEKNKKKIDTPPKK